MNKIPHEVIEMRAHSKEIQSHDFYKVNPFQKVPAIIYNNFKLAESHTIMRFLCAEFNLPDYYYPKDI